MVLYQRDRGPGIEPGISGFRAGVLPVRPPSNGFRCRKIGEQARPHALAAEAASHPKATTRSAAHRCATGTPRCTTPQLPCAAGGVLSRPERRANTEGRTGPRRIPGALGTGLLSRADPLQTSRAEHTKAHRSPNLDPHQSRARVGKGIGPAPSPPTTGPKLGVVSAWETTLTISWCLATTRPSRLCPPDVPEAHQAAETDE